MRGAWMMAGLLAVGLAGSAGAQEAPPMAPLAPPARATDPAADAAPSPSEAPPQADEDMARADPFEKTNRALFVIGGALDLAVIRPAAVFYKHVAPRPARAGAHNLVVNLGEPVNFANRVLQLRPTRAARTLSRFLVNSTLGVGGLFDVAAGAGLPEDGTNFGQTLGRYGVGAGPYLFLPVLGPSSVRDATGRLVDVVLDPLTWVSFRDDAYFFASRSVIGGLDARIAADPQLLEVQRTSTDPYATLRSLYLQNANFLANGGHVDVRALPDFGAEPPRPPAPPR